MAKRPRRDPVARQRERQPRSLRPDPADGQRFEAYRRRQEKRFRAIVDRFAIADVRGFERALEFASAVYQGEQLYRSYRNERDNLDQVAKALARVMDLLTHEVNRFHLAEALPTGVARAVRRSRDHWTHNDPRDQWLFERLLDLDTIRETAAEAHDRLSWERNPGQPEKIGVAGAVSVLADYWERDLKRGRVQQRWARDASRGRKRAPNSKGRSDQFIRDAMILIDPEFEGTVETPLKRRITQNRKK